MKDGEPLGHLTIYRGEGQSFTVGSDVTVEVVSIRGRLVYLRITAPRSIPILRDDVKVDTPRPRHYHAT